jgi:glucose-6-phosphate-specific signal transduction histidine kinase
MPERLGVMGKTDWWKQLAVAIGYGVVVFIFRRMAVPHYLLLCGVHVAALMLVPYRYWPSMVISEVLAQLPMAIDCAPDFGVLWSVVMLVPGIVFSGPIVYAFRERWHLFDRDGRVHTGMLLACALVVSVVMTVDDLVLLSTVVYPPGVKPVHHEHIGAQWLLGNFLGILSIVPTVLAIRETLWRHGWRQSLQALGDSRVVFESVCLTVPAVGVLLWLGFKEPHLRGFAQVAMFVPVVWLALRHGWQGAALGGTAASLALVWLMPENFDRTTIQAEVVVAFAISTMLLVGARIEALDRRAEKERMEVRMALALAQRNVHLGEMQLRMTAQALEQARETVRNGFTLMMGRLRHLQPAVDEGGYLRMAQTAQDQLFGISDSLHPVVWRERGLAAALREGTVARMLDQAGIRYWCELKGPVSFLSATLHLSLYRMICEAIAEGCRDRAVSDVCVRIRAGDVDGRRWVAVSIVFQANPARMSFVRWDDLLPRLMRTVSGMGLKAIKDRAATFEGYARERSASGRRRISWLMLDL